MSNLKGVELWQSYVGDGAPSNAAGGRSGLGWTQEQASENACHWNNQAPWERFKKITLLDHATAPSLATDEESLANHALRFLEDKPSLTAIEREALAHLRAGRFASAWLAVFPPTANTQAVG